MFAEVGTVSFFGQQTSWMLTWNCFNWMMDFKEKDVVWVKLCTYPWWPAQVTDDCIKFFNEDYIEPIKSASRIKAFNCPKKDSFIQKGLLQKNKEKKALFIQALNMASNISDGNSKYLEKFSCRCEDSSLTEKQDICHVNKNNRLDSCNGCAVQQDVFSKNQLGIESNDVNDNKLRNRNENNVTQSEGKLKVNSRQKQHERSDMSNAMETKSCTKNVQNMCSNNTRSPARTNYLEFKSHTLQQRIDWNKYDSSEEKKRSEKKTTDMNLASCTDLIQSVDSNILVDGTMTTNKTCVTLKKRKLTYDENCNENMKHSRRETLLNKSESSTTPKRNLCKNKKSLLNTDMIKTFTQLSQKSKENVNVIRKRGRPKKSKSMTEPNDDITSTSKPTEDINDNECNKTPKCLKWKNESFELPTPSLGHNDTCSSFLTNTSFDANLDKDTCDSSSDSDTDLPEGLSPIVTEYPICEKDIVWLKWKKCPTWPAYVRKVYKKKRRIHKLSLTYIECYSGLCKRLRVTYRSKSVIPFVDKQKDQFISEGESITDPVIRQKFIEACEIAENFLHKKALVSLNKEEFSFYGDSDDEEIESDEEEINPPEQETIITSSVPENQSEEMSDKEKERLQKMTAKQENLVNFIKSEEMKKYLFDIFYERRKCELHRKFFHGTIKEKNSLRFAGFGPIYNEEQEEEIVNITKTWLDQLPKEDIPDVSYILDVWIPEAVVYGLIKIKGYGRKKAWEQFEKGVYMTKSEKKRQHNSMMEFVGYTEEEKQEILEKAQERMETFIYQHGLT